MGLFDNLFKTVKSEYKYTPVNEQEAWVAILYAVMAVDGEVSESETHSLSNLLVFKHWFQNKPIVDYFRNAQFACKKIGNKGLIDACTAILTEDLKPTLFCLCMEIVMADGILEPKEEEIIQVIADAIKLEPTLAQKIVEVMLYKNKGNIAC